MKWGIGLLLALLLLSGCSAPPAATVFYLEDTVPAASAQTYYDITFGVPPDAVLAVSNGDGTARVYLGEDGRYAIYTELHPQQNAAAVMQKLSGFSAQTLQPIETQRLGMRDYRFSWCSETDEGLQLCTGAVLEDENCCYSLVFTAPEDCAKDCRELRTQVLDSFSLFEDEGF